MRERRRRKRTSTAAIKKTKISETGGLPDSVQLAPGMKVMLKRNINVQNGLGRGFLGVFL